MAVALQRDLDQVGAPSFKCFVVQPAARRQVGDEEARVLARRARDGHRDLTALRRRQVQRHGSLGAVEAAPDEARVIVGHRPAVIVQAALQRIDADHVRAELG
jgi:hypothetical protein